MAPLAFFWPHIGMCGCVRDRPSQRLGLAESVARGACSCDADRGLSVRVRRGAAVIEIIHADALTWSAADFAGFDTLIVDPPYSAHVHANAASVGVAGGHGLGAHSRDLGFDALTPELRAQIALAAGSVRRWSAIYSDVESTHLWRAAVAHAEYVRPIPWIRWSQPQLSGDRPCTILEIISVFHAEHRGARGGVHAVAKHWNGPGNIMPHATRELLAVSRDRALRGAEKHPTEKRLSQLLDLVSWFSDPGDAVLDLCAGSGSTGLAARLLGRDFVGLELDLAWAAFAARRCSNMALSPRDRQDADGWCTRTAEEALAALAVPLAEDGSNRNTRQRAERRLADVERVMGAV